ncbi:glycosyltransferase family 4 protein [candidate division WOR-3 bacterium]|nr:glycosyltransferase family 4 protein [candidate division WOR-3 bacterium]
MKILHISTIPIWIMNKKAGMPSIYKMIEFYDRKGFEQTYCFFTANERSVKKERILNRCTIVSVPIPNFLINNKIPYFIKNKMHIIYLNVFRISLIKNLVMKSKPNIIISHLPHAAVFTNIQFPMFKNKFLRKYGSHRNYQLIKENKFRFIFKHLEKMLPYIFNNCGYILVNDGTASDRIARMFGVNEKKILFMRNGVDDFNRIKDAERFKMRQSLNIPKNAIIGIFVNRLIPFKGINYLVEFINKTAREELYWIIIGDGPDKHKIINIDNPRIKLLGTVSHENLHAHYQTADFLASFNVQSNLTNPVYEAIRNKLPVFSLKRGYDCEIINEILFTENTVDEIVQIFNNKYEVIKNRSCKEYIDIINRMEQWEKEHFYSWDYRFETEWEFLKKRMQVCGKE